MTFRGFFALNGTELVNSSRVVGHLGHDIPTNDLGIITGVPPEPLLIESPPGSGLYLPGNGHPEDPPGSGLFDPGVLEEWVSPGLYPDEDTYPGDDVYPGIGDSGLYLVVPSGAFECQLVPAAGHGPGLFEMPSTAEPVAPGLYWPPDGSRRWGNAMLLIGDMCWQEAEQCNGCSRAVEYDDSWTGLHDYLGDTIYRTELAPWYSTRQPESTEFTGIWVTKVEGLDTVQVERPIRQMIGSGGSAGPQRDATRTVKFQAYLLACSNAGLTYGLKWLTCRLRETNDNTDSVLRFLTAHPDNTAQTAETMVREAHGVVLTKAPEITNEWAPSSKPNQQATIYEVSWEMGVTSPYVYLPPITLPIEWDVIETKPINWLHGADCAEPENCDPMPVLFSKTCVPEVIEVVASPPPVCGGCMPVCAIEKYTYRVPTMDFPLACHETAVNLKITNDGLAPLTIQAYWRVCQTDIRCEDNRWPFQINGLEHGATIELDAVSGRYWAWFKGRKHIARGIVGTPSGAPWQPTILDRAECWEFVVVAPGDADFSVTMQLVDREP